MHRRRLVAGVAVAVIGLVALVNSLTLSSTSGATSHQSGAWHYHHRYDLTTTAAAPASTSDPTTTEGPVTTTTDPVTTTTDSATTSTVPATTTTVPATTTTVPTTTTTTTPASVALGVSVSGNRLVDQSGKTLVLRGVDRSGTEYACVQGWGIFDGPSDATSIAAMKAWGINAVRVPLNEDCWLGINGVNPAYSGSNYRSAVAGYVQLLNAAGIYVILDLHWTAPGTTLATGQVAMPDADHAPTFWTQVATAYKSNPAVILDMFNEPYPANWRCWLDGTSCGLSYAVAGMQTLLNAIRATGAANVVMAGGLAWANDLSQWLQHEPADPLHQLAASWHSYNFNACSSSTCWDSTIEPVAAQVPVVTGEFGENDCADSYVDPLMTWMDQQGISYLAWAWDTDSCAGGPALISNYDGTPTNFGAGVQNRLLASQ